MSRAQALIARLEEGKLKAKYHDVMSKRHSKKYAQSLKKGAKHFRKADVHSDMAAAALGEK